MKEFDRLVEIIRQLRNPQNGCPWDLAQTSHSLIPNFIEELYESIEAIENEDQMHLAEELGDLLLHIVMQAQIAEEAKHFSIEVVLKRINQKLIRRHPHVFGEEKIESANEVKMNWEKIKMKEKSSRRSILDGIPEHLPALIFAQRIQEKAASIGFDWKSVEPALQKLHEEIEEFEKELESRNLDEMKQEIGDILFSVVNVARKSGFDAESCLRLTNNKFDNRFKKIEKHHYQNDLEIEESDLEKLDELWNKAKKSEL